MAVKLNRVHLAMATELQTSTIIVREAQPEDLPQVRRLGARVFSATFGYSVHPSQLQSYLDEHYSIESIEQDFADPNKDLLVASDTYGLIFGFVLLTQGSSEPCVDNIEDKIELQRIYVGTEHHGKGIGRLLFDKVESVAGSKGFRHIWLGVWEENFKAQKVYRKLGYEVVGDHGFALGDVVQTDWIMVKRIR